MIILKYPLMCKLFNNKILVNHNCKDCHFLATRSLSQENKNHPSSSSNISSIGSWWNICKTCIHLYVCMCSFVEHQHQTVCKYDVTILGCAKEQIFGCFFWCSFQELKSAIIVFQGSICVLHIFHVCTMCNKVFAPCLCHTRFICAFCILLLCTQDFPSGINKVHLILI